MRRPLVYSLLFHLVVGTLISVSLISNRPAVVTEEPVVVDLVPFADRPNPPPVAERERELQAAKPAPQRPEPPQPRPQPRAEAVPEPAPPKPAEPKPAEPKVAARIEPPALVRPPEPVRESTPPPKPEAKPVPKVEPKEIEPKPAPPKPEPKADVRPEPEPQPKAEPRPKPPEAKPEVAKPDVPKPDVPKPQAKTPDRPAERQPQPAKPTEAKTAAPAAKLDKLAEKAPEKAKESERKPDAPADFASVMKTVEGLKHQPSTSESKPAKPAPPSAEKSKDEGEGNFTSQMAQALRSAGPAENNPSLPVSQSEIDAVRRQIEQCWNLPAGAKDAGNLIVAIRVEMNLDGTPRSAVVQSSGQQNNPFYQAAAESARRAVLNPRCHPFKLPPDKYDRWRTMTLIFNPKDMAGT